MCSMVNSIIISILLTLLHITFANFNFKMKSFSKNLHSVTFNRAAQPTYNVSQIVTFLPPQFENWNFDGYWTGQASRNKAGLYNASYNDIYSEHLAYCSVPSNNLVLTREDGYFSNNYPIRRDWSLSSGYVQRLVDKTTCATAALTTEAVSTNEASRSCGVPWYSPQKVCDTLYMYAQTYWLGDSLTRHQTQAMMMLLRGDFRSGSFPISTIPADYYRNCSCDGQFSGSAQCRQLLGEAMNLTRTQLAALCHHVPRSADSEFIWAQGDYRDLFNVSCPTDQRPLFFFIQGGHHKRLDQTKMIGFLSPFLEKLMTSLSKCLKRVQFVFSGATLCRDDLLTRYPHQHRYFVQRYNLAMRNWFASTYPDFQYIDFVSVSSEGLNRTSDGFHSLSDINLVKALSVLRLMELSGLAKAS